MAKLNVVLELDYLGEDETIDERIQKELLHNVENMISIKVLQKLEDSVLNSTKKAAENAVSDAINKAVQKRIEDALTTRKTVTDKYGEVVDNEFTIEKLVKKAAIRAMEEKTLDSNGRACSQHNASYSLFEYFSYKQSQSSLSEQIKKAVALIESELKNTEEKIESMIKDNIQTNVADKLTNIIMDNSTALGLKK